MIDILFKGIDERQNQIHANGTIGGDWIFAVGPIEFEWKDATSVISISTVHKWFASYTLGWKVTIPAGCDSGNAVKVMGLVKERLAEVYPEALT